MRVSEIRVKRICVNQGLGVDLEKFEVDQIIIENLDFTLNYLCAVCERLSESN